MNNKVSEKILNKIYDVLIRIEKTEDTSNSSEKHLRMTKINYCVSILKRDITREQLFRVKQKENKIDK